MIFHKTVNTAWLAALIELEIYKKQGLSAIKWVNSKLRACGSGAIRDQIRVLSVFAAVVSVRATPRFKNLVFFELILRFWQFKPSCS